MSRLRVVCPFLVMLAYSAAALATIPGWYTQTNPTTATLNDIQAIDANTAYAVGANGTILKTTDGGATWTKQTSNTTDTLSGVYFLDASNGWAAGKGTVLKTTDGGTTWISQSVSASSIEAIAFPTASVGVAIGSIGSQGFLRTTDGGAVWTALDVGNSGSNRPQDVFFLDGQRGWAVGMNASSITTTCDPFGGCYTNYNSPKTRMWSTTDAGATWTTTTFASTAWLRGVVFVDANNGWFVGDNGLVCRTTDGGTNWYVKTSGTTSTLYAIDFADASNGWAAGANGVILHTTDGGETWTAQTSGVSSTLNAIDFVDSATGWAVGAVILRTGNGGSCTTIIDPKIATVSAAGETRNVSVTTAAECAWTSTSGIAWISITSGNSGSGSGSVSFTAEANSGTARQGTIEIAGVPFMVTQAGASDELTIRHLAGAATAQFRNPVGVAADVLGYVYVADFDNPVIRKVSPSGTVTTLAKTSGDPLVGPGEVDVDAAGNLYIADTGSHTIRIMSPSGAVTTLAGTLGTAGSDDGTGSSARFNAPRGIVVDASGNVFVSDSGNHTIRKVTPTGVVTTIAGLAGTSGSTNGSGTEARFSSPEAIDVDASGNLYVVDAGNSAIRKVTPEGVVTTFVGSAYDVVGIAVDDAGSVYVTKENSIGKVGEFGFVNTIAGVTWDSGSTDGTGGDARFGHPKGIAVDGFGNVYVADTGNRTIRKVTPAAVVTTLAGSAGGWGGDEDMVAISGSADGTGAAARFYSPQGVGVDGSGNVYVGDTSNHTIRKITPAGVVTTLAGTAGTTGSADGTGAAALFNYPTGVAVDGSGNVYVADRYNYGIRRITPEGVVTTFAGGSWGSADGTGTAAKFNAPESLAIASDGTIYVADTWNHTIRKITTDANVTTLAGTAGSTGSADGTGSAARFNAPGALALDSSGNIYVADSSNHTIRKVTPGGEVTTIAGAAGLAGNIDGTPLDARFNAPGGIAVDGGGRIYVADTSNHVLRMIPPSGLVVTVAGLAGTYGYADGKGSRARLYSPAAIAVDSAGSVYVADMYNHAIRTTAPGPAPAITSIDTPYGTAGTVVMISGSGFREGATVRFGTTTAAGAGVSATSIVTVVPAGSGTVDVTVVNPDGQSATLPGAFTYVPPPVITAIDPAFGSPAGGTHVAITGSGFIAGAVVRIGGAPASAVVVSSDTLIFATTPPGSGVVALTVRNRDGQSATLPGAFNYAPPPSITSVTPSSGPSAGGTPVTIIGANFLPGATVSFGGYPATNVTFVDPSTITAITPAYATGSFNQTVTITLNNPDGNTASLFSSFTYIAPPSITSSDPRRGPSTGGTAVVILGTGFVSGATVRFGGTDATSVTFVASGQINATTPAGTGVVDLTVTNPDGQSATKANAFTYEPPPLITSVAPSSGPSAGGTLVTITGANFKPPVTAAFGGIAATNVFALSASTITANTPAHDAATVDVEVRNADGQAGVLAGAFTYTPYPLGDANGDGTVTPADLIYLINTLFANGPAPAGSGDADGDGNVDINDVFYLVNYLFAGGAAP